MVSSSNYPCLGCKHGGKISGMYPCCKCIDGSMKEPYDKAT